MKLEFALVRLPVELTMAAVTENDWRFAAMPLTAKGEEIKEHMEAEYGAEKGEQVFYASRNAGTISGVDGQGPSMADVYSAVPTPDGRSVIG